MPSNVQNGTGFLKPEWLTYSAPEQFEQLSVKQQQFVFHVQPKLHRALKKCRMVDSTSRPQTYRFLCSEIIDFDIIFYVREGDGVAMICEFR